MDRLEQAALSGQLTSKPLAHDDPDGIEPRRGDGEEVLLIEPRIDPEAMPVHPGGGRAHEATRTGPKGVLHDYQTAKMEAMRPHKVGSPSGSESDADDQAIEAYRRARLEEMRRTPSNGARTYGHLREIGFVQFDDAVLAEPRGVKVVLLLYEPVRFRSLVV